MTRRGPISPPHNRTETRAALDRPARAGHPTFADAAVRLLEQGYEPLPIRPREKRPAPREWTSGVVDADRVAQWAREFPNGGVGLRTGRLVGVDIDLLGEAAAHDAEQRVRASLGDTPLVRVGLWPKRLLLYRTAQPFRKLSAGGIEVLAQGQQLVAFGVHPATGAPYYWPLGETPLDVPFDDLPLVDEAMCRELLGVLPVAPKRSATAPRVKPPRPAGPSAPVRDGDGIVVDGRDGWLSAIAFHAVLDAIEAGRPLDVESLAANAWGRFESTTDLARGRKDVGCAYVIVDAERKVRDKLRLHHEGRLPPRGESVEADYQTPTLSVAEARAELDRLLGDACRAIEDWLEDPAGPAPRIGLRATVGLGKSLRARSHVLALRERLRQADRPSRIVVVTPSHALADEAAVAWRESGLQVAVLRGYHAKDPKSGDPMCRDTDAVAIAIEAGTEVSESVCCNRVGQTCPFLVGCLKQENRRDVAAADVVIAAYDALFTGFSGETDDIGVVIVDEGCWQRAARERAPVPLGSLMFGTSASLRPRAGSDVDAEMSELADFRRRLLTALSSCEGPASRDVLLSVGLTEEVCRRAATLEERRIKAPKLRPGMDEASRKTPRQVAAMNARARTLVALWGSLADHLARDADRNGRVCVEMEGNEPQVVVHGAKRIHPSLAGKPVLHLDATLRPDLARTILPQLRHEEVEAAAPHMRVTLVTGSFGKGTLCPGRSLSSPEASRRANRRRECVDYVRWQAAWVSPGRVLVITYKSIERDFANIPGVSVAHFNAIAGLDAYRDVRLLIVIGRPLPSDRDLLAPTAALLGHAPDGGYRKVSRGVRMRDGSSRAVEVIEQADGKAELMRAAICDDEVIQAIGRGRGVNRTAENPLDVHVLADVALPLVHDRIFAWDAVEPDIVQRMLMEGVAVDSPADAVCLHPNILGNEKQAQKAFLRAGFRRHSPMSNTYRDLSLKSAAYRRGGRGRSWQRAYWLTESPDAIRDRLISALGDLAEWKPHSE